MQRHSESRFDEIYQSHREEIARYIRRRVSAEAVEDLLSETFLVCWRKLDEVPPQPLPWLYAVARKTLANHYRATAPRGLPTGTARTEDAYLQIERDDLLARAFARLSEPDREVLRLVAWEQLSLRDLRPVRGIDFRNFFFLIFGKGKRRRRFLQPFHCQFVSRFHNWKIGFPAFLG